MPFMRRDQASGTEAPRKTVVSDESFSVRFPTLWEYLTETTFVGGGPRLVSSLLAFTDGPDWKLCLNDREEQRSAWAAGETVLLALEALEYGLQSNCLSWRTNASPKRK